MDQTESFQILMRIVLHFLMDIFSKVLEIQESLWVII